MRLLVDVMKDVNGRIAIATHSTSVLSSLFGLCRSELRLGLMHSGPEALLFQPVSAAMKSVLPMFGAHPLSNVFNERPPLIVEGEDDERIWQSAVRRSEGRISLFPCVAKDIQSMNEHEIAAGSLIESVYEDARAFSLRDRDDEPYEIGDVGPVIRMRLSCRSAENLIVTDDVLVELGTDWPSLRATLEKWITDNPEHRRIAEMKGFQDSGWNRKNFKLKDLRMLIVGLTGSTKPWEVAVGQAIAQLHKNRFAGADSLLEFIGKKAVTALRLTEPLCARTAHISGVKE